MARTQIDLYGGAPPPGPVGFQGNALPAVVETDQGKAKKLNFVLLPGNWSIPRNTTQRTRIVSVVYWVGLRLQLSGTALENTFRTELTAWWTALNAQLQPKDEPKYARYSNAVCRWLGRLPTPPVGADTAPAAVERYTQLLPQRDIEEFFELFELLGELLVLSIRINPSTRTSYHQLLNAYWASVDKTHVNRSLDWTLFEWVKKGVDGARLFRST